VSVGTDDGARGQFHCGFDNAVFMSERQTGFNNFALAHFMRARHDTSRR
jgi:glutaminase